VIVSVDKTRSNVVASRIDHASVARNFHLAATANSDNRVATDYHCRVSQRSTTRTINKRRAKNDDRNKVQHKILATDYTDEYGLKQEM
jgi:hypothetical protein